VFLALLAIFIIIPLLELWVIFEVGSQVGFFNTFVVLIAISATGAALAKRQGYRAVAKIQQDINQGRMPGDSLLDGALVLAGALLLLTPGFITDVVGLIVLLPPARKLIRRGVQNRLKKAVERRRLFVWTDPNGPPPGSGGGSAPTEPEQRRRELGG